MSTVTLKGNPIHVDGSLPAAGSTAPAFSLVAKDLKNVSLTDFAGKRKILNIFPSVDTPPCATWGRFSTRDASGRNTAVVLFFPADLPFAQARFCGAEGLAN